MSFATNGIVNVSGGDPSTGGNSFSDPNAQYGGVAVGSADSFLGVSANSSVVGNSNTMSASTNAGVLGRGNTLYDSNFSWIVGGDGKTYNSQPNKTFIPNRYVVLDSGNMTTSTGSAAAAPRYVQLPGVVAVPTGVNDEFTNAIPAGSMSFNTAANDVYVKKAAGWAKMASIADTTAANTLAQVLTAGNITSASDIVVSSPQQIKYVAGVRVGMNNTDASAVAASSIYIGDGSMGGTNNVSIGKAVSGTSANDNSVIVGAFAASGGAFGQVLLGANTVGAAGALYGVAVGLGCEANAQNCVSVGHNTICAVASQIKLGNDSTTHVYAPGYIKTDLQKACAAGITPGVSAAQSITTGSGATLIDIKDILFDWSTAMVDTATDRINLTDTQQIWGVSALIRGTFAANPTTQTFSATLFWFDGATAKTIAQQDVFVAANAPTFNITLASGMKTNASAGQYLYCSLTNTSGATMNITHYRVSASRVA